MSLLRKLMDSACDFLVPEDAPASCDLIFVLAGRLERKAYGLKLFELGLAPRLIVSAARFEVRGTAALIDNAAELLQLRDVTPPEKRHFWLTFQADAQQIHVAALQHSGTFAELDALAAHLIHNPPSSMALISTSIHLARIRFCCSRIPFFAERKVYLWAVPESDSSFHRYAWWERGRDCRYVCSEYLKLAGYHLLY